jgi:dipeptidyl aminopeptidase/acylaminoacyl peptidase
LLYDRYDIWSVAPDGASNESGAVNLTQSAGRKGHLIFRYVKLDPEEESVDTSRPLLLHAENDDTYEAGFYRLESGMVHKLVMSAREYGAPVKANDADVFAVTAGSFSEYPDIEVTDATMKEMHRASNANPQKEGLSWGTSELVSYVNADGVHLHAALYKPENFDPKKKYPMLVYIYERLARNVNHFVDPRPSHTINFSYYTSNGYLVLTPDIVYTEGYPGQSALKCVLPAIQAMVDRGFVNPDAIGIQGHSWGGYQIAYMITQTNRFRAAAAGAPVANMTSAYDGIRWGSGLPRQFQYEKTQSRIGGSLWEYPMRFIENSPLFQADRIRTPLLMIHNDADDAVPWYQGIEFFLALRRLGKEVYMFSYNGEPHGLRRRPNQKDYTLRLQQYFDHYLKGSPAPDWMVHGISYLDKQAALAATDAQP